MDEENDGEQQVKAFWWTSRFFDRLIFGVVLVAEMLRVRWVRCGRRFQSNVGMTSLDG